MNNKIIDYISGMKVNATPEELEAVQPLVQELVEVYGYDKSEIRTHPQFRISLSPSDEKKSYPVDIAVFEKNKLKIICECKKISSPEGKEQLRKYLRMCEAKFGVWFNGKERIILKKIENNQGISFQELNDILLESKKNNLPHYKQTSEESKVFYVLAKEIKETQNLFLIPAYYNGFLKLLSELKENKKDEESFFISIGELIERNILFTNKNKNIPRGKAVDSHFYCLTGRGWFLLSELLTSKI